MEAYHLATSKGKRRGKAARYESMEWSGLLYCINHPEPRKVGTLSSKGRYTCNYDYAYEAAKETCMDITGRFLDGPLTDAVLQYLDLTPFSDEVLIRLESESNSRSLEESQNRQRVNKLEGEKKKWQALLTSCVDETTGKIDREREEYYWEKIKEIDTQLEEIRSKPVLADTKPVDYSVVRNFLQGINRKWGGYSSGLRNRFLKLLIDRVEICGDSIIQATIYWKNGFRQEVSIHRPPSNSKLERRWTEEEIELLKQVYQSSLEEELLEAFPGRSWKGIAMKAYRLELARGHSSNKWRPWSKEDDSNLVTYYESNDSLEKIAEKLGRSVYGVRARMRRKGLTKPKESIKKFNWEISHLISPQQSSTTARNRGRGKKKKTDIDIISCVTYNRKAIVQVIIVSCTVETLL